VTYKWATVPLGSVIHQRKEFVRIDDTQTYNRCRVQLHAQGIVLRDKVTGAEVKTKTQQVCRAGEFLVAEIDAKVGGYGIVPDGLSGAIVSSHYFLFEIDTSRLDRGFLGYFARTPAFAEQVAAQGSTNYAAVRPAHVLGYKIPLPPLAEQRRIVAKIDAVAGKVQEAYQLKQQVEEAATRLLRQAFWAVAKDAQRLPIGEVAPLVRRPVKVDVGAEYPELGVRSFGKGTFHKPPLSGTAVGSKKLYRIEPGDLVFNNVFAWEGAVAVAQSADAGRVGSHRFITCVPRPGLVTATFLCFYFLTGEGLERLGEASPGGAGRNRTLGLEALAKIQVPVPPLEKQAWFDFLQAKTGAMRALQAETTVKLDAMLPAILDRAFKGEL
jgi:type I restriction enzyme, S subunit